MDFKPGGLTFFSDLGGKIEEMGDWELSLLKCLRFTIERKGKVMGKDLQLRRK